MSKWPLSIFCEGNFGTKSENAKGILKLQELKARTDEIQISKLPGSAGNLKWYCGVQSAECYGGGGGMYPGQIMILF